MSNQDKVISENESQTTTESTIPTKIINLLNLTVELKPSLLN